MTRTLLLNANMVPLTTVTTKRAIMLLLSQKAEVLEEDPDIIWESPSSAITAPVVIRLVSFVKVPYIKNVGLSKRALYARDQGRCQYCDSTKNLTMDHIIPKSRGGQTRWTNVSLACFPCNSKKGSKTLEELGWKLKKKPIAPKGGTWRIMNLHGTDQRWKAWIS